MTGSETLENLPPEARAVLSLVLAKGRSYRQIAELLRIDPAHVGARAHRAAEQVAPAPKKLPAEDRARIVDYLLGEQSVSERARTRNELLGSGPGRQWAIALGETLEHVAEAPLPAIPEADKRSRRRWRLLSTLTIAIAGGVAGLLLLTAGGTTRRPSTGTVAPAKRAGASASRAQTLRRLVLVPGGAQPNALGAGAIVRQGSSLRLLLQARGLVPNHNDSYAVWLFNAPGDSRLLGLVSPLVDTGGRFSAGVSLPDDAIRFHSLLVTREKSARPGAPGQAVLRAPLSLS